jgi:hypothetical protein
VKSSRAADIKIMGLGLFTWLSFSMAFQSMGVDG